jgi:hypothetical protein
MNINTNLSTLDRFIRGIIGFLVLGFAVFNGDYIDEPIIEILMAVFGLLNLVSLLLGWCMVYQIAGISTKSKS